METKLKKNLFRGLVIIVFFIVVAIFIGWRSKSAEPGKTISSQAQFVCGESITFTYNGSSVTYGTVTGPDGKCWMDRNLGATQVATASTDVSSFGHLFQWGRGDDGHQIENSKNKANTQSSTDSPGHANFIYEFTDWRDSPNDKLWQGVDGANNPCPIGWRLPTQEEWNILVGYFNPKTSAGAYNSALKLPLAGYRNYINAMPIDQNKYGYYWSSSTNEKYAYILFLDPKGVNEASYDRAYGYSVRCVKD